MNFFEHQDRARKTTRRLVVFFILSVVLIIVTLALVITTLIDLSENDMSSYMGGSRGYFDYLFERHLGTIGLIAGVTLLVIGGATLVRLVRLAQGGRVVAEMMGARQVSANTQDFKEKRLLNVVDEMAIASGITRPAVYVMDDEPGINAFAAGYTPNNAVVAVTRGTLDRLNREELQGVVAHEFSHILNGDMRLNIRMLGVLAGILLIGNIGLFLLRSSHYSRDSRGVVAVLALGLVLAVIGYIGVLFGRLLQSGVSRQREFLADASAVQFTRYPDGIANALNKIRYEASGSLLSTIRAGEVNHMCFGESVRIRFFSGAFASHPPLEERIKRIQPGFDLDRAPLAAEPEAQGQAAGKAQVADTGMADNPFTAAIAGLAATGARQVSVENVVAGSGTLTPEQIQYGAALRQALPDGIKQAVSTDQGTRALLYCMVLDADSGRRERQVNLVSEQDNATVARQAWDLYETVSALDERYRWPLLEISLPVTAAAPAQTKSLVRRLVRELVMFDGKVDYGEFIVLLAVESLLAERAEQASRYKYRRLPRLEQEIALLLGLLARAGADKPDLQRAAFQAGAAHCGFDIPELPPMQGLKFSAFVRAIGKVRQLTPLKKQVVIEACTQVVMHDGVVNAKEEELLRILAGALEVPLAPFTG